MPLTDTGILLINLGTPSAPDVRNVRRYLKQFLSDPRVVTLPTPLRWLLLNCIILPSRANKSAHAYQSIWQPEGSPLLINSQKIAAVLANDYRVALGMRYGEPSIEDAIVALGDVKNLLVLPLFPQYSMAATGSAVAEALRVISKQPYIPYVDIIWDFYNDPAYITAMAANIAPYLQQDYDYLLTSYHGLPVKQAGDYKQHCEITSQLIATQLQLPDGKWGVSFQSRLGRLPWIKPYTTEVLPQLYAQGVRKLLISCPSFVADCLETLEEIGIQANQQWQQLGGTNLTLIPCLNEKADWIKQIVTN